MVSLTRRSFLRGVALLGTAATLRPVVRMAGPAPVPASPVAFATVPFGLAFAASYAHGVSRMYRSTDGGASWEPAHNRHLRAYT